MRDLEDVIGLDGIDEPTAEVEWSSPRLTWRGGRFVVDEWGRSESIDPDNVGDIADEGAGHRG